MSTDIAKKQDDLTPAILEQVLLGGDLERMRPQERVSFMLKVCESLGLNPLTKPFEFIKLNGKLTMYARKDCTEQLRSLRGISVKIVSRELLEDVYVVTSQATDKTGRCDESIGAVPLKGLSGEAKANALMKAETKSKRRVTLSISGLGILDEAELESIPGAHPAAEYTPPARDPWAPQRTPPLSKGTPAEIAAALGDVGKELAPPPSPLSVVATPGDAGPVESTREPGGDDDDEPADGLERVWVYDPKTGEQLRQEPKAPRQRVARIHILRVECGLTEDEYHTRLLDLTGKKSTAELSASEADTVITKLEERKKRWGGPKEKAAREAAKNARKAQRAAPENVPPEMLALLTENPE